MNRPDSYLNANYAQRRDAEEILEEYSSKIKWRSDGRDSVIDIGSGTGDVLFDLIYPRLTYNYERIVCSDINQKMVEHAKMSYSSYERTEFVILNIESDKTLSSKLKGKFDHVTSFYCLHWIHNQRQALQNVYDLLKSDGGDCLLIFLVSIPIYDVYFRVKELTKWGQYMKDMERFTSILHRSENPAMELSKILESLEFTTYNVEIKEKVFNYNSIQILRDNIEPINPYLDRIPPHLQKDFMDDFVDAAIQLNLGKPINNGEDYEFPIPYKLAVIYAGNNGKCQNWATKIT